MQNTFIPVGFFAQPEWVVVGHNPEMADYDNPRGEIIRTAAWVVAEDAKGYRVRCYVTTGFERDVMPEAEKMAEALNNRLKNLGKYPVALHKWQPTFPGYGSDAYIESGQGQMDAWMDRQEELVA